MIALRPYHAQGSGRSKEPQPSKILRNRRANVFNGHPPLGLEPGSDERCRIYREDTIVHLFSISERALLLRPPFARSSRQL